MRAQVLIYTNGRWGVLPGVYDSKEHAERDVETWKKAAVPGTQYEVRECK